MCIRDSECRSASGKCALTGKRSGHAVAWELLPVFPILRAHQDELCLLYTSKRKSEPVCISDAAASASKRPLVLTVDSDAALRDSLKIYLQNDGYEVIAVSTNVEAREVLDIFTPVSYTHLDVYKRQLVNHFMHLHRHCVHHALHHGACVHGVQRCV